jgi:hypothetical protein
MRHVLLLSLALCILGSVSAAERDPVFDGVWKGTFEVVGAYGPEDQVGRIVEGTDSTEVRLRLRGETAQLTLGGVRITPQTAFRIAKHDAAELVYAATAEKGYVGTWQLSLTKVDADTVLVLAWRVQNFADGKAVAHAVAHALRGELKRSPSKRRQSD